MSVQQANRSFLFIDILQMNPIAQSCKGFKPPIYPKYEKASTIRIELPVNGNSFHSNKFQREEKSLGKDCKGSSSIKKMAFTAEFASQSQHLQKEATQKQEQQQYTRKNYFRSKKNQTSQDRVFQSDLTDKAIPNSQSMCREEEKRLKSKSALNKYFIKQVSVIPTDPSSNTPLPNSEETPQCPQDELRKNTGDSEQRQDRKSISVFSHEERQKSRKKISDRLKSIKRGKSKAACSNDKDKQGVPSKSVKKIPGNIGGLEGNQSNVLRMKARARNRRVILKVKQYHSRVPKDDLCLMVSSKIDRSFSERREVAEKIEFHLQLLNLLPAYVKEFKEIYDQAECWDELIFLVYKKFYIQRLKVQLSLTDQSNSNPFRFSFCSLSDKDLQDFRSTIECIHLQQRLSLENASIGQSLRKLYNHIIQKSGRHVNLYQLDNFSQEIYYLMNEELKLLRENEMDAHQAVRQRRVLFIVKCCLMVAFLNGEPIHIDAVLAENHCTPSVLFTYSSFIQYYTS